ncbi:MAG TPA: hypothetical protein VN519_12515 [Bryobacteraceae bacterium]|nr:hypothetical protein [Bryobacteraceae bacterium]
MNWVTNPMNQIAILCGVLGIGMLGSLTLWISTKMDVRAVKKALDGYREATEAKIEELRAGLEKAAEAMKTTAAPATAPVAAGPLSVQGLDLTNRTKALRMARRGEPVGSIAASLGVAQEEIELLLKLERLLEVPAA